MIIIGTNSTHMDFIIISQEIHDKKKKKITRNQQDIISILFIK